MTWYRTVLGFSRALADRARIQELPLARWLSFRRPTKPTSRSEMLDELLFENTAGLDEQ